ncbi:hypothetical protein BJ165DRAFT_1614722 [Panaeolus papilionaceus]|nr:hypothetical protein BJ165DRAFT_1614722 [Panaeolus papilionaceus]
METHPLPDYTKIQVVRFVSVESVENVEKIKSTLNAANVIVLLGPTGTGKSTFIEALASNDHLKISGDQLEGVTQSISVYRLVNIQKYIGDEDYINVAQLDGRGKIVQRVPHSVLHALTGIATAEGITVCTTMWDRLWSQTATMRAESNFNQLRNEIWKEYVGKGTQILKFHNTQQSALAILDAAYNRISGPDFELQRVVGWSHIPVRETAFGTPIYNNLQARIENVRTELTFIQSDLDGAGERADAQLTAIIVQRRKTAQGLLTMFTEDNCEFGPRPDHPEIRPYSESLGLLSRAFIPLKRELKILANARTSPQVVGPNGGEAINTASIAQHVQWTNRKPLRRE